MEEEYYNEYPVRCKCNKILGRLEEPYEQLLAQGVPVGKALDMIGLREICCRMAMMAPVKRAFGYQPDQEIIEGIKGLYVDAPRVQTVNNPLQLMGGGPVTRGNLRAPEIAGMPRAHQAPQVSTVRSVPLRGATPGPGMMAGTIPGMTIMGVPQAPTGGALTGLAPIAPLTGGRPRPTQTMVSVGAGYEVPMLMERTYYEVQQPQERRVFQERKKQAEAAKRQEIQALREKYAVGQRDEMGEPRGFQGFPTQVPQIPPPGMTFPFQQTPQRAPVPQVAPFPTTPFISPVPSVPGTIQRAPQFQQQIPQFPTQVPQFPQAPQFPAQGPQFPTQVPQFPLQATQVPRFPPQVPQFPQFQQQVPQAPQPFQFPAQVPQFPQFTPQVPPLRPQVPPLFTPQVPTLFPR